MERVNVYIDGYNLYHAIDRLNDNRLKWLDLTKLISHFLHPNRHTLNKIHYFSAYATWKKGAFKRHKIYTRALDTTGVNTIIGGFKEKDRYCRSCKAKWKGHEEKETDVNIALNLLNDAYQDEYDEAIIVSQDSDLFPAIKLVKKHFPEKIIRIITPPNLHHSREMASLVGKKRLASIKEIHLQRSLLPREITTQAGKIITRPAKYDSK